MSAYVLNIEKGIESVVAHVVKYLKLEEYYAAIGPVPTCVSVCKTRVYLCHVTAELSHFKCGRAAVRVLRTVRSPAELCSAHRASFAS